MQLRKHHKKLAYRNRFQRICHGLDEAQKASEASIFTFPTKGTKNRFIRGFDVKLN